MTGEWNHHKRTRCTSARVKRLSLKKPDLLKQKEMELAQVWSPEANSIKRFIKEVAPR
jgi:hypothetical protein